MVNYSERLNDQLFDRKISPEKLSADLGVSLSTVYRWKNSETELFLSNLVAIADYFCCAIDFILCYSEDMSDFPPQKLPSFSKKLREVMKKSIYLQATQDFPL